MRISVHRASHVVATYRALAALCPALAEQRDASLGGPLHGDILVSPDIYEKYVIWAAELLTPPSPMGHTGPIPNGTRAKHTEAEADIEDRGGGRKGGHFQG